MAQAPNVISVHFVQPSETAWDWVIYTQLTGNWLGPRSGGPHAMALFGCQLDYPWN